MDRKRKSGEGPLIPDVYGTKKRKRQPVVLETEEDDLLIESMIL